MEKKAIILTEEEWRKVIQLVDAEAGGWGEQNEYDDIKTKMLFQWGMK